MESKIPEVYEVFKDYYGEDRVDLQGYDILVYFPKVTITNEAGRSIDITDLYVKTTICDNGTMNGVFTVTRGSYPLSQIYAGYLHSHVLNIPTHDNEFKLCCTGTGPIVRTMLLLAQECDLDRWALYCFELDKYTQVESEIGIPYHHLTSVSTSGFKTETVPLKYASISCSAPIPNKEIIKDFLPYLINRRVLNFSIANNYYLIAHPFLEYITILTTTFIEYLNSSNFSNPDIEYYIRKRFLVKGTYENGVFQSKILNSSNTAFNPEGLIACTFKGQTVIVTVTDDITNVDDSVDIIVHPTIANFILYKILATLNYGNITCKQEIPTEEVRAIIL